MKLLLEVIKPQVVVDHRVKEAALEVLTPASYLNNIRTYLMPMQERKIELDTLRKDGVKYDMHCFTTLLFDALLKTKCPDFLADIKSKKSE